MKAMKKFALAGLAVISVWQISSATGSRLSGAYLGQALPGRTAVLFAPGDLSTADPEICISFTPDGKEIFYTVGGLPHAVILHRRETGGFWTEPEVAPFSGRYSAECQLSPDGMKMFFCSGMPASGHGEPKGNWNIWMAEREIGGSWGIPLRLNSPLGSDDFSADCPSVAANGSVYFYSANYPGGRGKGDLYVSRLVDGAYQNPENLGPAVNTEHYDMDPFIAPDESYLVFSSSRPGGLGENDLYVSFRGKDGAWTPARNLGSDINSEAMEIHPFVSRDGKYLFFSSTRRIAYPRHSESPLTLEGKLEWLNRPGNGSEDIYWAAAEAVFPSGRGK